MSNAEDMALRRTVWAQRALELSLERDALAERVKELETEKDEARTAWLDSIKEQQALEDAVAALEHDLKQMDAKCEALVAAGEELYCAIQLVCAVNREAFVAKMKALAAWEAAK